MSVMKAAAAAALIACALLIAACGGSNTSQTNATVPVTGTGGSTTSSSVTTPTTTTTTSTASSTTTTSAATGPPPCVTADFALRFLGQEGATGHGELGFALRNISGHQCRTYGYPGVLFLDKTGGPVSTTPTHTTTDFFGTTTKTELVVLPGADVSFRLGVSHGAAGATGCTTAYGLQVIAPDDTHTTTTTIPQGAYECGGEVTVTPLQAADLAFTH
jgi:hypothetical protein